MNIKQRISALYKDWSGEEIINYEIMPQSGSYRQYFRVSSKFSNAVAVYNEDKKENHAFIEFSKHFLSKSLPVPEIFAVDNHKQVYLQQDLGNTTLLQYMENIGNEEIQTIIYYPYLKRY